MGHHAEDAQTVSVLGRCRWLTCSMQHFDSEEWLPILDEEGQDTGDIVILTLMSAVVE